MPHLTISVILAATADYGDIGRKRRMPHLTISVTSTATAHYTAISAATVEYRNVDRNCRLPQIHLQLIQDFHDIGHNH